MKTWSELERSPSHVLQPLRHRRPNRTPRRDERAQDRDEEAHEGQAGQGRGRQTSVMYDARVMSTASAILGTSSS